MAADAIAYAEHVPLARAPSSDLGTPTTEDKKVLAHVVPILEADEAAAPDILGAVPPARRAIWWLPALVVWPIALAVVGVTGALQRGIAWLDASWYVVVLDVVFTALGFGIVKTVHHSLTSYIYVQRRRHRRVPDRLHHFHAATAANVPLHWDYAAYWLVFVVLQVVPLVLYAGSKLASADYRSPGAVTRFDGLQIDGIGGCDSTQCHMVSNEAFVNITRESTPAVPAGRFAAAVNGSQNGFYFMPMWPDQLFDAAAQGELAAPALRGASYAFNITASDALDIANRTLYCHALAGADTDSDQDPVLMSVNISTPDAGLHWIHEVEICLPTSDQNNLYIAPITMEIGASDVVWVRDDAGVHVASAANYTAARIDAGAWHASISNLTLELALVYRNTLNWYRREAFTGPDLRVRQQAVATAVHAYAQTALMRAAQPNSTLYSSFLLDGASFTATDVGFRVNAGFCYAVYALAVLALAVTAVISFGLRPEKHHRADIVGLLREH